MRPQEKYYEYWGLTKPPLDNVPDPDMYFDMHTSVENAVGETLFAIEEGNECLAVIVGDVGLGKTMTLRVILDSLEQEKYRIAFITNPDITFIQLLKEIIGQLTGEQCLESTKEKGLEIFNQLLFQAQEEGKKTLIFIDEGNAMKSANLESMRLLTNMQGDNENHLTIILAGQLELAQRLEHPSRANLFQRIGVYCRINKIESRDLMRDYIEHRLERAGMARHIFTDDAYDALWEGSEHGIPRLINKVAKLALKAGQTQSVQLIDAAIVHQIVARFSRISTPILPERRERIRTTASMPPQAITPTLQSYATVAEAQSPVEAANNPTHQALMEMIKFPDHIYLKAKQLPADQRAKFAGQLAAEVLKKYPQLIRQIAASNDPVPAWSVLRNVVVRQIEQRVAIESIQVGLAIE